MKQNIIIIFALIFSLPTIAQNIVKITINNHQTFNFSNFESVIAENNQGDLNINAAQYKNDATDKVPNNEILNVEGKPNDGFIFIVDIDFKNHLEKLPVSEEKTLLLKYTEAQSGENYDKANNRSINDDKQQFDIYFKIPLENQSLSMEILTGILQIKRLNETDFIGHFDGTFVYPDAPLEATNTTEQVRGEFSFKFHNTLTY